MTLLRVVARSVPRRTMNPPYPLACLDTPRHHSLMMQLVVMGLVLVLLVLKLRL